MSGYGDGGTALLEGRRFAYPAFRVRSVDSTGAGDAFVAGLLFGLLRQMTAGEAVRFAAACGALATLKRGAIPSLPTLAAVERLLRR